MGVHKKEYHKLLGAWNARYEQVTVDQPTIAFVSLMRMGVNNFSWRWFLRVHTHHVHGQCNQMQDFSKFIKSSLDLIPPSISYWSFSTTMFSLEWFWYVISLDPYSKNKWMDKQNLWMDKASLSSQSINTWRTIILKPSLDPFQGKKIPSGDLES